MAKTRKFVAYRRAERPYTRFSKFKKYSFVKARPVNRIVRMQMGSLRKTFEYTVNLLAKSQLQIRDMAIESARLTSNRLLEGEAGKASYRLVLYPYPHHILRENPIAAGAGADRMSTGMKMSFGKPVGVAAQIKKGQRLMSIEVNKQHLELARRAAKRASHKLPCSCMVTVTENK